MFIGATILGLFLILFEYWLTSRRNKCTVQVNGRLNNLNPMYSGYVTSYTPEFTYVYNGTTYTWRCFDAMTKKTCSHMVPGQYYTIIINPDRPKDFIINHKRKLGDICMLCFGYFFVVCGILGILV